MKNIINILACPVTKGRLEYDKEKQFLISHQAKLAFKIIDGVPNMLVEDALPLADFDADVDSPAK